jgi:hypothetical protein
MLSSVLNSPRAIEVNIQIIRVFIQLREMIVSHKDLARKIEDLEKKFTEKFKEHDQKFILIFRAIKELISDKEDAKKKKGPMGFVVQEILISQFATNIQRVFLFREEHALSSGDCGIHEWPLVDTNHHNAKHCDGQHQAHGA